MGGFRMIKQTYFSVRASFCYQRDEPHDVYDFLVGHLSPNDAWKVLLAEGCLMDLMVLGAAHSTSSFYKNEHDLLQKKTVQETVLVGWNEIRHT
jgi:hypothetical protein